MPRWVTQLDFDLAIAEIPSGPPGPQGVQGDPGTNGTDGGIGPTGPVGPIGPIGPIGETGEIGATGSQGIQGQTGNTGQTGNQGIQGIQGVPGETGATGADGPQGIPGVDGTDGTDGSDGAEGEQGIQGIQGIQGTQGIPGVPGTTLHSGLSDVTADQHHVAFVAADHAALPNPHHSNANDHANTLGAHSWHGAAVHSAPQPAEAHTHPESDVTSLVGDLAGKAASTHNILTAHNGFPGGTTTYLRADGSFAAPAGGGSFSATTVEVNLATVATWRGTFTITDAGIGPTSKVLCWQAPGPYTGKGTRADEAEAAPVQVIAVAPASGSAKVYWRSVEGFAPLGPGASDVGRDQTGAATLVRHGHPSALPPLRVVGKVRGNVKFSYVVG